MFSLGKIFELEICEIISRHYICQWKSLMSKINVKELSIDILAISRARIMRYSHAVT